jgi:4'-phosphopantetheinyl transferase
MYKLQDNTAAFPHHSGELTVWRLKDTTEFPPGQAEQVLSRAELNRAGAMAEPATRRQYLAGRLALRTILGRYTNQSPAALVFTHGSHQKPELVQKTTGTPVWHFSLAHTHGIILIAVGADSPLGVDVESRQRRLRNFTGLIQRVLTPAEQRTIKSTGQSDNPTLFLHYWTAKEACLKAIGTGLAQPPKKLRVKFVNETNAVCRPIGTGEEWQIKFFTPAPDFLAAVAAKAPGFRLTLRNFTPDA